MKKCIICGKSKKESEFNIEHIIPEALGNKSLKIDKVCTECNSKLGSKVDKYITTGSFMELIRNNYKVAGKNKKIPFPFKEGIDEYGNRVRLDNNFKPTIIPKVEKIGNIYNIKASSKQEAIEIIEKVYERENLNINQKNEIISKIESAEMKTYKPTISYDIKANFNEIELAILKIAYEYAYLRLGDTYYDDICGIEIRKIIQKAINNNKVEKYNFINHIWTESEFGKIINNLGKEINNSHFLLMQTVNNKIQLIISLFCDMSLSYIMDISDNADRYDNTNFIEFIKLNKT
ncbi:MAG TPA: HNH endonuclease [Candidatus Scatovivens faecipullorum]|nr:HNH endonuclease [Candidatus Scatovivens faecipullorum]